MEGGRYFIFIFHIFNVKLIVYQNFTSLNQLISKMNFTAIKYSGHGTVSPNHVVCDVNFWYHRQLNHQQEASPRNFNQSLVFYFPADFNDI